MSEYLTVAEVAETLRLNARSITRKANNGEIPAIKIGGVWRIPRKQFLAWIREHRRAGKWQPFIVGEKSGGSDFNGAGRRSESQLTQLLRQKPDDILKTCLETHRG